MYQAFCRRRRDRRHLPSGGDRGGAWECNGGFWRQNVIWPGHSPTRGSRGNKAHKRAHQGPTNGPGGRSVNALDWDITCAFSTRPQSRSFTMRRRSLHLSQSAISRQVSAPGNWYRRQGFHRLARGLILSEQGEILYQTAHGSADEAGIGAKQLTEKPREQAPSGKLPGHNPRSARPGLAHRKGGRSSSRCISDVQVPNCPRQRGASTSTCARPIAPSGCAQAETARPDPSAACSPVHNARPMPRRPIRAPRRDPSRSKIWDNPLEIITFGGPAPNYLRPRELALKYAGGRRTIPRRSRGIADQQIFPPFDAPRSMARASR